MADTAGGRGEGEEEQALGKNQELSVLYLVCLHYLSDIQGKVSNWQLDGWEWISWESGELKL